MLIQPSSMTIKSQDRKLFKRIRALSELKDDARFFKMLGGVWFLQTLRYSTDSAITTFECELIGVIKANRARKSK